uniref:Ricin B-type lectin domain-containing protein n=1 Tax=Mesocestoides corti TaxID=53468 RepID=A0A5K3EHV0_MESCO
MVKSARLTWGLSLCRLKIPSFLLDTGLGKHALSTSSITPPAVSFKGTARCQRHPQPSLKSPRSQNSPNNSDDIELALIITPSQLASHCTNAGPPITSAGVSDPRMRFIVYLVSLALSLAALSILKLHKLLEWLIMDSDVSSVSTRLHELRSKSALISEILKAAVLRYNKYNPTVSPMPSTITLASPPSPLPSKPTTPSATTTQEPAHKSPSSPNPGLCFHTRRITAAGSEQCLLCLVKSEDAILYQPIPPRHRCRSESTATVKPVKWAAPSRPNAGICRTQVASNASAWSFAVEMCSGNATPVRSGLHLASAVKKGQSQFWRLTHGNSTSLTSQSCSQTESPLTTPSSPSLPLFHRSAKLVACVAPTTATTGVSTTGPPSQRSPPEAATNPQFCQKVVPRPTLFAVLEEAENSDVEGIFASANEQTQGLVLATSRADVGPLLARTTCSAEGVVIRCDRSVDARAQTRDFAGSPLGDEDTSFADEDHTDAEGLELDDDGVYFASDYVNQVVFPDDEDEVSCEFTLHRRSKSQDVHHSEGLSNLVALTNSISDDLLQLESGCQELIHRVHANRIELDKVNDRLSFVWDNKDDCRPPSMNSVMENSWSSDYTHRYTPLGRSFISSTGSCVCNCQKAEEVGSSQFYHAACDEEVEAASAVSGTVLSDLTLGRSECTCDENSIQPAFKKPSLTTVT